MADKWKVRDEMDWQGASENQDGPIFAAALRK